MASARSHTQRFAALEKRPAKGTTLLSGTFRPLGGRANYPILDYDPEGEFRQHKDDDESGSEESEDGLAGTEHYVSVG